MLLLVGKLTFAIISYRIICMSSGAEREQQEESLEKRLPSLVEQNRAPFLIDMVYCIIPPKEATSGMWSLGRCEFYSETGEPLGNGDLVVMHPKQAVRLRKQITDLRSAKSKVR